jgi:23S rRNA (adenine2503-C2)-methyltransferase
MSNLNTMRHATRRPNLKDYSREALRAIFKERGWAAYRADQVATWLYKNDVEDVDGMTNVPAEIRSAIAAEFDTRSLEVVETQKSVDGTQKLLLGGSDS